MKLKNLNKLEKRIQDHSISKKEYLLYTFLTVGTLISMPYISKYHVNDKFIDYIKHLKTLSTLIKIVFFYALSKIIKDCRLEYFAYSFIPLYAMTYFFSFICITLPLIFISLYIIRVMNLNFGNWNVLNSAIIGIINSLIFYPLFLSRMKRILQNNSIEIHA